ncbi:MAG TPA: hypothetical protein PLU22_01865 [Polyangiaceae bacterium]|nr:hypothetical protein [Polyangiaceae bacterium]
MRRVLVLVPVLIALLACKREAPKPVESAAATAEPTAPPASAVASAEPSAPSAAPSAAPAVKGLASYPLDGVRVIADGCASPWAVLTVVVGNPRDNDPKWNWQSSIQALYAHPEFLLTATAPTKPMQIQLLEGPHDDGKNLALWARCLDGVTCNKLGAMYRAVVPTGRPWVYCGAGDTKLDQAGSRVLFRDLAALQSEARSRLESDVMSQCMRLGICRRHEDAALAEDVGTACARKPVTFKRECAKQPSCSEVVSCLGP